MSDEIKKIDSIKNMAVFQDFRWASSLRDGGNNIAEFKKIKEKDPDQYSALLLSIGVNEEPVEESKTAVEAQ